MNLFGETNPAPAPVTTYRAQISGWAAGDQGQVPVWMKNSADGTYAVPFHGHTLRPTDQGETEVFLDAWGTEIESALEEVPEDPDDLITSASLRTTDVVALAVWQLSVVGPEATVEWHCPTTDIAFWVQSTLWAHGIDQIDVRFTPAVDARGTVMVRG